MSTVKRTSGLYTILGDTTTNVAVGDVSTSPAQFTVNGNLIVTGNIGGISSSEVIDALGFAPAAVYDYTGAISDHIIFIGNLILNGNLGNVVTLPSPSYSNIKYKVQVTYDATDFVSGNAGFLMSNVQSISQFTVYSSNPLDTNTIIWTTFGSAN